jgi:hypothetical protein
MARVRFAVRLAQVAVLFSAALVAGCFSGGGSTTPAAPSLPAGPTTAPFSVTTMTPLVAGNQTYNGSNGGGFSSSLGANLSTPPSGSTTVTITVSATPPPGVPALSLARRAAQSVRDPLSTAINVVLYESYTTSQNTTETGDPVFTIGLPNGYPTTGVLYYLAIFQSGAWQLGYAPGVYNAGFSTVTLTGAYPLVFTANTPQNFALYYQASTDPTPSPPPSPTPTTAPTGGVGVGLN